MIIHPDGTVTTNHRTVPAAEAYEADEKIRCHAFHADNPDTDYDTRTMRIVFKNSSEERKNGTSIGKTVELEDLELILTDDELDTVVQFAGMTYTLRQVMAMVHGVYLRELAKHGPLRVK